MRVFSKINSSIYKEIVDKINFKKDPKRKNGSKIKSTDEGAFLNMSEFKHAVYPNNSLKEKSEKEKDLCLIKIMEEIEEKKRKFKIDSLLLSNGENKEQHTSSIKNLLSELREFKEKIGN